MSDDLMQVETLEVDGWNLAGVRTGQGAIRRIYMEGDGRAYISRGTPSGDPTPVKPIGLELALNDRTRNVLYLARPCQWVKGPQCVDRELWTTKRFTPEVVTHYVRLIERESGGQPVELVGYSGGAWVALQVAASLPNVTRVTTVAGNLMPDWVNAQHKVTRIEVAAYPAFRKDMPVVAYVGREDKIVGRGVVEAFERETGLKVEVREVTAGHVDGWNGLLLPAAR